MEIFKAEKKILKQQLTELGYLDLVKQICKAKSFRYPAVYILFDIMVLLLAAFLVYNYSVWFLPLSIVLIASRIRAFGNLQHDASHYNLCKSKEWNDLVAKYLLSPMVFDHFTKYRKEHFQHHSALGTEDDPDLIDTSTIYPAKWKMVLEVYFRLFLKKSFWLSSAFGEIYRMRKIELLQISAWWVMVLTMLSIISTWQFAMTLFGLILLARMTVYHAMRAFLEISDHGFLDPSTNINFTRTLPYNNILTFVLHPHNDNYHIAHHLFPSVPLYHLKRLHNLLLKTEIYSDAHHCQRYFFGKRSVLKSWMGMYR